jgi:hypothetical protein
MRKSPDLVRTLSRHTLAYMLCSISELFRHNKDFDPLDLLIIHAILNANVIVVMRDLQLDKEFGSMHAVEPDHIKQGVSRAALSRFLSLPIETIRRRVGRLKKIGMLAEGKGGLIVTEANQFKFGNNHAIQTVNVVLVRKLLRDLKRAGIRGPDDSSASPGGCGDGICFPTYDIVLKKRGRSSWSWRIFTDSGQLVMCGWDVSRPAARYQSTRALFLLLCATRPRRGAEIAR